MVLTRLKITDKPHNDAMQRENKKLLRFVFSSSKFFSNKGYGNKLSLSRTIEIFGELLIFPLGYVIINIEKLNELCFSRLASILATSEISGFVRADVYMGIDF